MTQMSSFVPAVWRVEPIEPYQINAYMNDGSVRRFDVAPLIEKGGVFAPLRDKKIFVERIMIMNGTVAWDIDGDGNPWTCVDIAPCTLAKSPQVDGIRAAEE